MKAYDENAKYILFINKSITILGCSTVNSLTIGFLGHISQHLLPYLEYPNLRSMNWKSSVQAWSSWVPDLGFFRGDLRGVLHLEWKADEEDSNQADFVKGLRSSPEVSRFVRCWFRCTQDPWEEPGSCSNKKQQGDPINLNTFLANWISSNLE